LYPEKGYILARILNSFSHIDIEKWDQVTKLVKTLYPITQHENDLTIMLLFEVFAEIDVSNWEKIRKLISAMLTQEIHLFNISNTLKILVETKGLNWENVIKLGQFLNDSKIEFHHIWGAFDALLKIEESKREKVVSFILSLVSLKIDRKAIPTIIEIFEKVEESKWEKSAEIVRLLLPNFSSEFINIFTIKSLIEIESREVEEVAALAWPFFGSDIDNLNYYPALIQAIDKIVCKKNITPFDKIYFLLKGDIVKGKMEGWLKEIIRGQINGDPLNFVAKMNDVEKNFLK
ncbi:MAG: hypothetical protein K0M45_00680, partial [Candidatus Paracaedibacteraceae bacterium]|nr:hypothetical protein [Candidatus Paracaedibacteraceae bacterium]